MDKYCDRCGAYIPIGHDVCLACGYKAHVSMDAGSCNYCKYYLEIVSGRCRSKECRIGAFRLLEKEGYCPFKEDL